MPWSGSEFAKKNKSLTPSQADHAARIANAILKRTGSDRLAIATANARVEHPQKRAAGGITIAALPPSQPSYLGGTAGSPVNLGALPSYTPQAPANSAAMGINANSGLMNTPQVGSYNLDPNTGALTGASQAALQNYAQRGLTINGQQQGAAAGGGATPAAALPGVSNPTYGGALSASDVQALQAADPGTFSADPGLAQQLQTLGPFQGSSSGAGRKRGGAAHLAPGGMMPMSMADPSWSRQEMSSEGHPSGLVNSPIGGRSDHIPIALGSGSYVVPADVVSGMGQGNTLAGAHAFDSMIHGGPYGTKLPMPKLRGTLPKPPGMPKMVASQHFSRGGRMRGKVPVIVAGGERIVSPAECKAIGGGDIKRGHAMLDRFVVECRKHVVAHTKALPGPVGAKKR